VLFRSSIYTAELERRGIPWEGTVAERLARTAHARDLMEVAPPTTDASTPLEVALGRLAEGRGRLLYVVDAGPLRAISLTTAKQLWAETMRGGALPPGATAGDHAVAVATVEPDDTLLEVGEKLWTVDWGELPVVDPLEPGRLLGVVTRRGLLGAFDRELIGRDLLTTRVLAPGADGDQVGYLELPDGHRVAIVPTPAALVGRPPDPAALRADLGVILIAVQRPGGGDAGVRWHDADTPIALGPDDRLMVIATAAELARLDAGPNKD